MLAKAQTNNHKNSRNLLTLVLLLFLTGCVSYRPQNTVPVQTIKSAAPQYVAIRHGELEYYRFGSGSPIVMITGYVTDITSWDKRFLAALAKQHQLIVFNNRNVGGSHVQSNQYSSQDLANDTYQLIENLHLHRPTVLGISMGGMIAQQVAVLYPGKISDLILINTAIAGHQSAHPDAAAEKIMLNMPTNKLGRYYVAVKLFFPPSQRAQMGIALVTERYLPQEYTEIDPAAVVPQQRALIRKWAQDDVTAKKLARLNMPVLILNGAADAVIPPVNSAILAKAIPHAYLKRWPDGGHAMIFQYPEMLAAEVNDFIAFSQTRA